MSWYGRWRILHDHAEDLRAAPRPGSRVASRSAIACSERFDRFPEITSTQQQVSCERPPSCAMMYWNQLTTIKSTGRTSWQRREAHRDTAEAHRRLHGRFLEPFPLTPLLKGEGPWCRIPLRNHLRLGCAHSDPSLLTSRLRQQAPLAAQSGGPFLEAAQTLSQFRKAPIPELLTSNGYPIRSPLRWILDCNVRSPISAQAWILYLSPPLRLTK